MEIIKQNKTVVHPTMLSKCSLLSGGYGDKVTISANNYYVDSERLYHDQFKLNQDSDSDMSSDLEEGLIDESDLEKHAFIKMIDEMKDEWIKNFQPIPDYKRRRTKFLQSLNNVNWNCSNVPEALQINQEWCDRIHDSNPTDMYISRELSDDPEVEEGLLSEWLMNLKGEIKSSKTMIHFPMIICEKSIDESLMRPLLPENTYQGRIINSCKFNQTNSSYLQLSAMKSESVTSSRVDKGDFATPKFTSLMRRMLAKRGVQAKEYYNKNPGEDTRRGKTLHPNFDTTVLEDYLCKTFNTEPRDTRASVEYELDKGTNVEFTHNWFNLVSEIEEFQCLEFHDTVLSEVTTNASRNVEKDVFIVRKVPGYQAYVIIKPTQLGSVHDPKPTFYSIIFRGKSISQCFETVYEGDCGWNYTDFISTSRVRSSHHLNSAHQFQMMIYENLETLCTLSESPDLDTINSVCEPIKWCLCAHLQDREEFASNTSNFRYYYFSLFSGLRSCKAEAEQLATKLPDVIRDPLNLLATRRLISYHNQLDSETLSQETSVLSHKAMKESTENIEVIEDSEYDTLPKVITPFGFVINNTRTFLKAAYMSIYHNKDESEKGPAAKQIVAKFAKQEHHMTRLLKSGERPECWTEDLGKDLPIYRFNANGCIVAADLLKLELLGQSSIPKDSPIRGNLFDLWIEESVIIPALLGTTYDILASTRSSYVDNGEIQVSRYKRIGASLKEVKDDDVPVVGETIKCLEAVLGLYSNGKLQGMSPSDDLETLISDFDVNGGKLVIKIFKKNQLQGVREIYILTMVGRMLVRMVEDIARAINSRIHQEKLTSPETRDSFIAEHKSACGITANKRRSITVNISGDKTQWANYLQAKSATLSLIRITPKRYHPLIAHVFNGNTKKEIEIPAQLMESFIKNPETDLEVPILNEIKDAVLRGKPSAIASYDSSRLKLKGNTMQGIAHYTSSTMHTSALLLLKHLIRNYLRDQDLESVVSFEVSSDDKGLMVTVFLEDNGPYRPFQIMLRTTKKLRHYERVIDACFGIRDSRLKSVTTISVAFEFNSTFYFGNSITTPMAKFTVRCCDDSVQSTMHNRVAGMYSSVRQIRDNGGSGILCSLATMCQHICMKQNLGFKRYSWWDSDTSRDYNMMKFSHLGYRKICSPITAGLCMSDFENTKVACLEGYVKQYNFLRKRDLDSEELPDQLSMVTSLWKKTKHQAMLKRVGLEWSPMTIDESLLILKMPETKEETRKKIELMALSSSLSRSYAQVQRSDLVRAGVYLLWADVFKLGDEKTCYHNLILSLSREEMKTERLPDVYEKYHQLETAVRFYYLRNRRSRLMPRSFSPLVSYSYVRSDVVSLLRQKWLGQGEGVKDYTEAEIMNECTWITETKEEFFEKYEPIALHRFLNSIPTVRTKVKLLARGNVSANSMIECLMRDNTSADCWMKHVEETGAITDITRAKKFIKVICHRISIWIDCLDACRNNQIICMIAFDDIVRLSQKYEDGFMYAANGRQEKLCCYVAQMLKQKSEISTLKLFKLGTSDMLRINIKGSSRSVSHFYTSHFGVPFFVRKVNNNITDYSSSSKRMIDLVSTYEKYQNARSNTIDMDYKFIPTGFRSSRGSLVLTCLEVDVGGIIGVPCVSSQDAPPLVVRPNTLDPEDADLLKSYVERSEDFTFRDVSRLIDSDSTVAKAVRYAVYRSMDETPTSLFRPSQENKTDAQSPVRRRRDEQQDLEEIRNMTEEQFENFKRDLFDESVMNTGSESSEEEDEDEEENMASFIEMYGFNEAENIPGVDFLESETKHVFDVPDCVRKLRDSLRSETRAARTPLNENYHRMFNKMKSEAGDGNDASYMVIAI